MKSAFGALALILLLGGCVTDSGPQYSLTGGEKGVFTSRNAGTPIPLDRIKGLDEAQLAATVRHRRARSQGRSGPRHALPVRRLQPVRLSLPPGRHPWKAEYADAYDLQLRPLPVDQCAGSVAAQKKRVA